jgi:hypothetical protein
LPMIIPIDDNAAGWCMLACFLVVHPIRRATVPTRNAVMTHSENSAPFLFSG